MGTPNDEAMTILWNILNGMYEYYGSWDGNPFGESRNLINQVLIGDGFAIRVYFDGAKASVRAPDENKKEKIQKAAQRGIQDIEKIFGDSSNDKETVWGMRKFLMGRLTE